MKTRILSLFYAVTGVLFIISDSVLAVNKFVNPVLLSTLIIMGTYIAAQWLITAGYIRQFTRRFE
jgi:uncharacterized membrane protein YhhN